MKNPKSISFILLVLLISCTKFKHEISTEETIPSNCALCNYADQISGQYRGYAFSQYSNWHDSLTLSIEHIFLNLGPQTDSTTMYFRRVFDYDTRPTRIDTVLINNSSGNFTPVAMQISGNSLNIYSTIQASSTVFLVTMSFNGTKIP
jgi:hypothetical protein